MLFHAFRASKGFVTLVVSVAVFTDTLLQNLLVPVLPYALHSRIGLQDGADIQHWTSILSAAFGGAFMVGSCTFFSFSDSLFLFYHLRYLCLVPCLRILEESGDVSYS